MSLKVHFNHITIDDYHVNTFLKDGNIVAFFKEMPYISAFAKTKEQAIEELKIAWELVKETKIELEMM